MRLSSDTPIRDLIDVQTLHHDKAEHADSPGPYLKTLSLLAKDPATLEEYHKYLFRLKVHSCMAIHEKEGTPYDPDDCPTRSTNFACLHALDFSKDSLTQDLIRSDDWPIRLFGLAYILNKKGYDVPYFIEDFEVVVQKLKSLDSDIRMMHRNESLGLRINDAEKRELKKAQIQVANGFKRDFVDPIKAAYADFYTRNVVSDNAGFVDDQSYAA